MAILNPKHLLEQAERLIQPPPAGPPRQVDLRRAISSAYYAVFHAIISAAADQLVGATLRQTREYGLVSRSIDHRVIKETCAALSKSTPPPRYLSYIPDGGFGPEINQLALIFPGLQAERHLADYDPLRRYRTSDANSIIATARSALAEIRHAPQHDAKAFLFLLLFPPRGQ